MAQYAVEQCILRALWSKVPPASRYKLTPGDLVRVYREGPRKWVGPVELVKVERKSVHASDGVKVKCFKLTQVMPVTIGHRTIDEDLDCKFSHSDNIAEQEKEFQVHLMEVLNNGDPCTKNSLATEAV